LFSTNTFKDLADFGTYSNFISQALGLIKNPQGIRAIQCQDTLEPWGVTTGPHIVSYGRHLQYVSQMLESVTRRSTGNCRLST
jgi:hypothetical protein